MRQGDEVYYLHGDHLGSVSLTTDSSGEVVSWTLYSPYGGLRDGNTGPTDFGFTAQRQEMGFGLYDYNARFYSPVLGRFISPDTIIPNPLNPQDFNRYTYARNNSLRYNDPTGHCPECVLQGFIYEITANNYDALFIPPSSPLRQGAEALAARETDNVAFQTGRLIGGVANVAQGLAEINGGVAMAGGGTIGGTVTSPSGVGAVAGYGVAVVGAGVAVHGGMVAGQGAVGVGNAGGNIYNAIFGGGGSSGSYGFPKEWNTMSRSEQQAFQHAYSRHADDFGLPNWSEKNAEILRVLFNEVVGNVKMNAQNSFITRVPYGERGGGLPGRWIDAKMYEYTDMSGTVYYYMEKLDGTFISSGLSTY